MVRSVQDHPVLSNLNLSGNHLAKSDDDAPLALEAIGDLLRSQPSQLETLDLSRQREPETKATPASSDAADDEEDSCQRNVDESAIAADLSEGRGFSSALAALATNAT